MLIYVPGLGRSSENTADTVADVVAKALDVQDSAIKYTAVASDNVVTPIGLTVSKTIVDPDHTPVLQLFQLNYRSVLDASTTEFAPSVGPGAVKAAALAVVGGLMWVPAFLRPAKTLRTKMQLALGFLLFGILVFAALVAITALLAALDLGWLEKRFPDWEWWNKLFGNEGDLPKWTLGVSALGLTILWPALRKEILALAALAESLIRFVKNQDVLADTISKRLDHAINALTDGGWTGPIHLLGYSFGSLVIYDAMFPRETALFGDVPAKAVTSMTTIGCPLDLVRLYAPEYVDGRVERRPGLAWVNVFNQADIFASNLKDGDDKTAGGHGKLVVGTCDPESLRYLNERISWNILLSGRIHTRYWRSPDVGNCFDPLVGRWVTRP